MTDQQKADLDIVDRIRQRIELFSPGGDNERLMLEAAQEIRQMRRELYEMSLLASSYANRWQKAISGGGAR